MDVREFLVLVTGLRRDALFPQALDEVPHRAETPEAIAAVFGDYYG
jgi:hypothetical protein